MITEQMITQLQSDVEAVALLNDALQAAFTNTTDPNVTVTLPNGSVIVLPCYLPLIQQVQQLKTISLGLAATPTDDYQVILNNVTNELCQVSRFSPIIPDLDITVSLIDDYFDIDGDSSGIGIRIDFNQRIQGSAVMMVAEYINGLDNTRFIRPINNNNISSAKIGVVAVDPAGSSDQLTIVLLPGETLGIGDTITVSGQLAIIQNVTGIVFQLDRIITTVQNATVYNVYPATNIYCELPLKVAPNARFSIISAHRLSKWVDLDLQDLLENTMISGTPADQLVSGFSYSSLIQGIPGSISLPIPDTSIPPMLNVLPPDLANTTYTTLLAFIEDFFADWAIYKDQGDLTSFQNAIDHWLSARLYANIAFKSIMLPAIVQAIDNTNIAIAYEYQWKSDVTDTWVSHKVAIPMMTQAQALLASPWTSEFPIRYDEPNIQVRVRTHYMYRQPSTQLVSNWSNPIFINEGTVPELSTIKDTYLQWETMNAIGSLNYPGI